MKKSEIYYQVVQKDGRIENFHLAVKDITVLVDLILELKQPGVCSSLRYITKKGFKSDAPDKYYKVQLHRDLFTKNDARGECVGYLEHYVL